MKPTHTGDSLLASIPHVWHSLSKLHAFLNLALPLGPDLFTLFTAQSSVKDKEIVAYWLFIAQGTQARLDENYLLHTAG